MSEADTINVSEIIFGVRGRKTPERLGGLVEKGAIPDSPWIKLYVTELINARVNGEAIRKIERFVKPAAMSARPSDYAGKWTLGMFCEAINLVGGVDQTMSHALLKNAKPGTWIFRFNLETERFVVDVTDGHGTIKEIPCTSSLGDSCRLDEHGIEDTPAHLFRTLSARRGISLAGIRLDRCLAQIPQMSLLDMKKAPGKRVCQMQGKTVDVVVADCEDISWIRDPTVMMPIAFSFYDKRKVKDTDFGSTQLVATQPFSYFSMRDYFQQPGIGSKNVEQAIRITKAVVHYYENGKVHKYLDFGNVVVDSRGQLCLHYRKLASPVNPEDNCYSLGRLVLELLLGDRCVIDGEKMGVLLSSGIGAEAVLYNLVNRAFASALHKMHKDWKDVLNEHGWSDAPDKGMPLYTALFYTGSVGQRTKQANKPRARERLEEECKRGAYWFFCDNADKFSKLAGNSIIGTMARDPTVRMMVAAKPIIVECIKCYSLDPHDRPSVRYLLKVLEDVKAKLV